MIVIIRLISFLLLSKPYIIPFTHAHSQIESPQLQLLVVDGKDERAMPLAKAAKRVRRSAS
jgi:hypothetical protein